MEFQTLVSVIIPTKNSEKTIEIALKSVRNQTYPNIEIIVVDNHSTDRTLEIARKYGARIYIKGPERSSQRNYGAQKARGEYLIFLDSDIELTPNVVQECIGLVKKGYDVITFPEIVEGKGYWAKCRALEALCYIGDDTIEAPRFYNKNVFYKLGGFDERLVGPEDWDLREKALRAGYKIGHIKAVTIHHEGKVNPIKRIKKKFYYGNTMSNYIKRHPHLAKKQIPFLRSCYIRNWRLFIKDPLHALGFMILKTGETLAVILSIVMRRFYGFQRNTPTCTNQRNQ